MCGITGYSGSFNQSQLASALTAISHRGPDDSGTFVDGANKIGFAHARLAIVDLSSAGHQPMQSVDGKFVLIFNGEIYNHLELRRDLESGGYCFRGHSDTEVLLSLYLECDKSISGVKKMLHKLNGIFTFAIWDVEGQSILIARDALGVKPLYYSITECGFSFASEIKALLPFIPHRDPSAKDCFGILDPISINRYLSFIWCPGEGTPHKSIRKLGPGEAMWIRNGRIEERVKWYTLPVFRRGSEEIRQDDIIEGTVKHVRQAVQRQMMADVPVGAFLSGGLDSSSLVAFARECNPGICCYTIKANRGDNDGFSDDLPYARKVAAHLGVPLEVVEISPNQMVEDLEGMVAQLDEPLADPAALNILYMSRRAREQGIKVLLSGVGGDDLFSGYRRHRGVILERFFSCLPGFLRSRIAAVAESFDQRNPFFRRFLKFARIMALDGDCRLVNYFRWIDQPDLNSLYSREFKLALGNSIAEEPLLEFLHQLPTNTSGLERMLSLDQRFFLADHNFIYTDKLSMATGVEVRVPFLDLDLVEYVSGIPSNFKQRYTESKWVLKKAMEPYLPKDVIYRSKTGLGAPIRHWMRNELREYLNDLLSVDSIRNRGIFDPEAVQLLIRKNHEGKTDASYTLLSLVCLELWCRRFVDNSNR